MINDMVPDLIVKTMYDIPMEYLKEKKVKGLILDLDNTIAPYSQKLPTQENKELLLKIQEEGLQIVVVSNNHKERVEMFMKELDIPSIANAKKPLLKAYRRAKEILALSAHEIAVVGDQIYTDVWGGNKMGMITVLVSPIETKESLFFKLKRLLEKPAIDRYYKKNAC